MILVQDRYRTPQHVLRLGKGSRFFQHCYQVDSYVRLILRTFSSHPKVGASGAKVCLEARALTSKNC
jgi:hypothetical protein